MRYELADYEWIAIKPMLPNKPRGAPRVNDRRVLNGIFRVLRSGAPWRDLPEMFGPYTACYNRFVRDAGHSNWCRGSTTMSMDKAAIVSRLGTSEALDLIELATSFVMADDTRFVSDRVVRIKVSEALSLWETRLKNTEITKQPIYGASRLVEKLRVLDPNSFIEQFGFMSPRRGGNLFFSECDGKFIGLAIGDRPDGRPPFV
jgi:transposase